MKLQALLNFCINKREYISSNPVNGLTYSKVTTVNTKNEISPTVFTEVINSLYVTNYQGRLKELLLILWNTGMRIGEAMAIQLLSEDFREVDGVKCISINTENGKQVKNASSIRNIPINSHLNELYSILRGLPKGKPVLGWNKNNAAASRVANSFMQLGYKHSTHDFRYSLSNRLRDIDVADSVRYCILGHAHTTTTDRVYITRKPLL
ncbi:tyrosine-type recombinase/integrase [Klebsiella aerogenes]|uniref:tyrosine-type recombinase/integrase n=1 Tax=Klebsiella aerogenes TaxID=548 RepID=UPI00165233BE|nr:tyrosine-type recombinase/integrase [Klebsiella aerogenes]HBS5779073.1 tyrosine-type recombinase/integrase [Klebsiella aerogenes]